jgi:hypothetical protein
MPETSLQTLPLSDDPDAVPTKPVGVAVIGLRYSYGGTFVK